jgi:hypothetical protein
MHMSEISNRETVLGSVISELNCLGIKIRNEKLKHANVSRKSFQISKNQANIFSSNRTTSGKAKKSSMSLFTNWILTMAYFLMDQSLKFPSSF